MAAPMQVSATKMKCLSLLIVLGLLFSLTLAEETSDEEAKITEHQDQNVMLESVFDSVVRKPRDVDDRQSKQRESETVSSETGGEDDSSGEVEEDSHLFSLTSMLKSFLSPVIEEFQVGSEENAEKVAPEEVTTTGQPKLEIVLNKTLEAETLNETVEAVNETAVNETDSSKKFKFQCVGRNITENTTLEVRLVNSSTLLEVLSFDKNRTSGDCVLVMFYAPWCQFCAKTAPQYNALARVFPQLEVLAVDAVHFSNLNARFGTVAVPNVMLFHQSRSAVRFNHTERVFSSFIQFIKNVTGLEPNATVNVTDEDYLGPLSSVPTKDPDYLLWVSWVFVITCSGYMFVNSQYGQQSINRIRILWQEHQHIE